jgi:hypothetical protein
VDERTKLKNDFSRRRNLAYEILHAKVESFEERLGFVNLKQIQ